MAVTIYLPLDGVGLEIESEDWDMAEGIVGKSDAGKPVTVPTGVGPPARAGGESQAGPSAPAIFRAAIFGGGITILSHGGRLPHRRGMSGIANEVEPIGSNSIGGDQS